MLKTPADLDNRNLYIFIQYVYIFNNIYTHIRVICISKLFIFVVYVTK